MMGVKKKKFKKKIEEDLQKIENKHKLSSDSENNELDELYELDNNIKMNKTMQKYSLEELHLAKTSHSTTTKRQLQM